LVKPCFFARENSRMESKYTNLLSPTRFRRSTTNATSILLHAESDRGRLLFCPAFRRLQQKAQVFSLESNAAVRSRLTHSLEVSQMGRYISDKISIGLIDRGLATPEECAALTTFVETACLMHDIGNPPFGHFGEAAISHWFRVNGEQVIEASCNLAHHPDELENSILKKMLADFYEFDGNPQGIRVVTKLQRNSDAYGLNLTITTIASYLKYNRMSGAPGDSTKPFTKKCGYFSTEAEMISKVREEFKYTQPQRFPLAYIMEAADDIAYCISDLEDSIEKGLVAKNNALQEIYERWQIQGPYSDTSYDSINEILDRAVCDINFTYTDFRTSLNRTLAEFSACQYLSNHEEILSGSCIALIPEDSSAGRILQTLKDYCREKVYRHEKVQMVELAGYRAIYGMLDQFKCLLEASESRFSCAMKYKTKDKEGNPIIIENKLLSIFPKNYKLVYEEHKEQLDKNDPNHTQLEWILRAHLVTDFISGMTDDFALKTYQILNGTKF